MMIKFFLINVIPLLILSNLCDASLYVCDKNMVPCGCSPSTVEIKARIINGENVIPYSWSMMVSLRVNQTSRESICGGTILSESYILTAAHCVDRYSSDLSSK